MSDIWGIAYRGILERVLLPLGDRALRTAFTANLQAWRAIQWLPVQKLEQLQVGQPLKQKRVKSCTLQGIKRRFLDHTF